MNQPEETLVDSLFKQLMDTKEELHKRISDLEERLAEVEKHVFSGPGVEA